MENHKAVVCSGSPCVLSWLQTAIRTCKHSLQTQISHSWVSFKPLHCPWRTHNICVEFIHKSQLATHTKRPAGKVQSQKMVSVSKTRGAKTKRCGDNVHWVNGGTRYGNKRRGQIGGIWAGFTSLMLTCNFGQFSGQVKPQGSGYCMHWLIAGHSSMCCNMPVDWAHCCLTETADW